WAVLEAVAGAASDNPDIGRRGMPVDQEVMIRAVFVLADPGLDDRRLFQRWKAPRDALPRRFECSRQGPAVAGGRIERRAAGIVGNLETAPLVAGNPVHEARHFEPDGKVALGEPGIPGRRTEEENVLAGRGDELSQYAWKDLRQPGTAREDEEVGR